MKVNPKDVRINDRTDAYEFTNRIFTGTASNKPYWKPSPHSDRVVTCEVCVGLIRMNTTTLNEMRSPEDPDDVTYELEKSKEEDHEIILPTDLQVIIDKIRVYIVPIFNEVAKKDVERSIAICLNHAKLKLEI